MGLKNFSRGFAAHSAYRHTLASKLAEKPTQNQPTNDYHETELLGTGGKVGHVVYGANFYQLSKEKIMLFNSKGQQVKVSDRLDSVSNPRIFAPLREVLIPSEKSCGNLFRLETRARIVDQRK